MERPFTMTPERAEQIRKAIWASHSWAQVGTHYTAEERTEIGRFWNTLPGGTSLYDAVAGMARGEHLKDET